jgi:hypothetical protein
VSHGRKVAFVGFGNLDLAALGGDEMRSKLFTGGLLFESQNNNLFRI